MRFSGQRIAEAIMKAFLTIFLLIPLAGCQTQWSKPQQLAYSGGDGTSCQQAVVIKGAKLRETGLLGEKMWLEQKYPGYRQTRESLLNSAGKQIDLVEFRTADGQTASVYFDLTDCWEK